MKRLSPAIALPLLAAGLAVVALTNGGGDHGLVLFLVAIAVAMLALVFWVFAPMTNGPPDEGVASEASEATPHRERLSAEIVGRALARFRRPILAVIIVVVAIGIYRSNNGAEKRIRQAERRASEAERRAVEAEERADDARSACERLAILHDESIWECD